MKSSKGRGMGWLVPVGLALALFAFHFATVHAASSPLPEQSQPRRATRGPTLAEVTLEGPTGRVTLPTGQPTIVHVWLQGCRDCMPAFEAMARLKEQGRAMPLPVVNVAYGQATNAWANRYGLTERLVFDPGSKVVRPMGISTFTTLVLDGDGRVLTRTRPTRADYMQRIERAAAKAAPADPSGGEAVSVAAARPEAPGTPWTLIAPLTLLLVGASWRLFPGRLARVLAPRPGFVSKLDWASVALQPAQRCPYCHEGLSKREDLTRCGECRTVYHLACAREGRSCTTLGCLNFRPFE